MLSKIYYLVDYPIKALFINSKTKSLLSHAKHIEKRLNGPDINDATRAKRIYHYQIRRYLGLGFFASFLPGTEAFNARIALLDSLLKLHESFEEELNKEKPFVNWLALTPFYFLAPLTWKIYNLVSSQIEAIVKTQKQSLTTILSYLPIVSSILSYQKTKDLGSQRQLDNAMRYFINPFRHISALLTFLHGVVDAILEIGADKSENSSFTRKCLKSLAAFIFIPLRIIASAVESLINLTFNFIKLVAIEPYHFVVSAISQLIDTSDKEFVYSSLTEVALVNQMKTQLEKLGTDDPNYKKFLYKPLTDKSESFETNSHKLLITYPEKAKAYPGYLAFFRRHSDLNFSEDHHMSMAILFAQEEDPSIFSIKDL